jgi:multiple sugar transport system permease protein
VSVQAEERLQAPAVRRDVAVASGRRRRLRPGGALVIAILVIAAILWLIPFAWAIATSLKPDAETTKTPVSWTASQVTFDAYGSILDRGDIFRWYFNSALVSVVVTALTVLLGSMAAFAFSRVAFRGKGALFFLIAAGLIVPFQALIVPLFEEMDTLGLVDTYWAIILPQIASPIAVLVFKRFFDGIPRELEESALVDGASMWRIYWLIWMPLSRATIAAVGIFTFVISWNNFIWPFVVTSAGSLFTIPVGLANVQTSYGALYAQQMALAVLGALPLLLAFMLFQRQIVQGIANTGLKG